MTASLFGGLLAAAVWTLVGHVWFRRAPNLNMQAHAALVVLVGWTVLAGLVASWVISG